MNRKVGSPDRFQPFLNVSGRSAEPPALLDRARRCFWSAPGHASARPISRKLRKSGVKQARAAASTHATMGMVMGKISEEMPAFTVLHKAVSYEVRKYGPSVVAECSYGPGGWEASDGGSPFGALARYIGVFGKAQNEQKGASEAIAMTAPVLVTPPASQKIAMTAPVLVTSCQLVEHGPAWWRHSPLPRSPGTSAAPARGWLLYPLRRSTSAAQAPEVGSICSMCPSSLCGVDHPGPSRTRWPSSCPPPSTRRSSRRPRPPTRASRCDSYRSACRCKSVSTRRRCTHRRTPSFGCLGLGTQRRGAM